MLLRTLKFRLFFVFVMCSSANAVDLTIVSPQSNDCVASQQGTIRGIAGQPIDVVDSDVIVALEVENVSFFSTTISIAAHSCGAQPCQRALDGNGQDTFDENGHPIYANALLSQSVVETDFFFSDVEQRQFSFDYDKVQDGNVVVSITLKYNCFNEDGEVYPGLIVQCMGVTPGPSAPSTMAFVLDRRPPNVAFTEGEIATILNTTNTCNINNDVINPTVTDASSDVVLSEVVDTQQGCSLDRIFRAVDSCGNGVEYVWSQFSPPDQSDIDISLDGYVCADTDCVADPDLMTPFASGTSVIGAQVLVNIDAPASCVTEQSSTLYVGDEQGAFPTDCDETPERCLTLFSGRAITTPGLYRAEIVVGACGNTVKTETLEFEVLDKPQLNFGGPYIVSEGENLVLDASGTSLPDDSAFGEIVSYEWDLDGNDQFEPELGIDQVGASVVFNTEDDGLFPIGLRITTSTGIVAELPGDCVRACEADVACETDCRALGVVEVIDVGPSCALGGPFQAFDGETLTFDQTAASPGHPSDPIFSYNWDFGDGFTQSAFDLPNPSHVYGFQGAAERSFAVTLELFDEDNSSTTCTTTVTIQDATPIISALAVAPNQDLMEGIAITFVAATAAGSSSDPIINHQWTFGDGQSDEGEATREVQHMYNQSGDYEVCLTVSDSDSTAATCIDINIGEVSPIPAFELPAGGLVQGQSATFDAQESVAGGLTDPIDRYNWKFTSLDNGNEAPEFLQSLNALTSVSYTFKSDGRYLIELTVWDTDSSATTSREVMVADAVPTAGIRAFYSRPEETVFEGESITLGAGTSTPGADADPIVQYIWNFGDGNQIVQNPDAEGRMPTGQNYAWDDEGNGTFIVELTVIDSDGSQATAQTQVSVLNVGPEMQLYPTEERIELGQALQFSMIHESEDPVFNSPTIVARIEDTFADFLTTEGVWTMDGIEFNPTIPITFDTMGEKVVRCVITDGDGGQTEKATTITVTPAAPQFEVIDTQNGTEGETLSFSLRVNAPIIGVDLYADVALDILEKPAGARVTTNDQTDGVVITFEWTPGFYDSGAHRLWLRAGQGDSSRERTVDIRISDSGRPLAVALGGSSARGTVSLFEFNEVDGAVVLEPTDQLVDIGLGAGEMVHSPDSGYLFVTVPGSNRVAVVDLSGDGTLIRRIPVGTRPTGIISGGGKIWVVSHGDNTIAAIDPNTLKVVATVPLNGLENPTDLVWLDDGFDGLDGAHIAVVASGNGSVGLVDPERVMQFVTPVEYSVQLGGLLTNIEANPVTNSLEISDETTRRIYSIAPSDLTEDFDGSNSQSYAITFAARDLLVRDGVTWVAQGDALLNITNDGIDVLDFTSGSVLSAVANEITSESLMLLFGSNRIKVYEVGEDLSLELKSDVPSSPVRKMLTLIAPAQ